MTKENLRKALQNGQSMDELFTFIDGQECEIYKEDDFIVGDVIIYIPDIYLHEVPMRPLTEDEIEEVLDICYTGDDFISICGGDVEKAKRLFYYVDWQTPGAAWDAGEIDDEDDEDKE